jgi:hypothetical protein
MLNLAQRDDISRGLMTRAIWKRPCINLFITYFARADNMLFFVITLIYPSTPVSSTKKNDHLDIAEILLKMAVNTIYIKQAERRKGMSFRNWYMSYRKMLLLRRQITRSKLCFYYKCKFGVISIKYVINANYPQGKKLRNFYIRTPARFGYI